MHTHIGELYTSEDEAKIAEKAKGDEDEEIDFTTSQLYDDVDIRLNEPVDTDKGFIQKETEVPVTSSSHSSDLAAKFLNFSDIPHIDAKIVSPMDVHIHHEAVLAKESSQPQSLYDAAATLTEFKLKKIMIDKMDKSESYLEAPEHRKCYEGLIKSNDLDKTIFSTYDFFAFIMNGLKITNLTQETLLGLAFKHLKGTHFNYAELEYDYKECYKALSEKLDWKNLKGDDYPFDLTKHVGYFFKNDLKYLQGEVLTMTYTTSITKTKAAQFDLLGIKDMGIESRHDVYSTKWILAVTQVEVMRKYGYGYLKEIKKKINVTKPETTKPGIRKWDPYTPYQDPQGFIYVDTLGRNRLMKSDELYKFSNRTLTGLQTLLDDITKNIRIEYLPKRRCSTLEKKRANIVIKAIDKQPKERRMMRSLEKFVGGRHYRTDSQVKIASIDGDGGITLVDAKSDKDVLAMDAETQKRLNQECVSAAEPTLFDDEDVTMIMDQTLIKLKAEKAKLLDEQIGQKLHDEEVQKAATRDKQEKANMDRALELQKQYDMLKGFNKEDLVALWKLVQEKFSSAVSSKDKEKELWVELKRLIEQDADDVLRKLQRYMHALLTWKLYIDFKEDNDMAKDLVMKILMKANKLRSKRLDTSSK
uniref:Uncharacterized protein n=1 Tax=Tanacetum cinerariifolium TaxID=118510 RepID=A0A6L2MPJ9_TANCI|nr:hypothetical protein [Tanacetum cinerariifolium]